MHSRTWLTIAAVAALVALAACSSSQRKSPEGRGPLTWCGQTLANVGGVFGDTTLDPPTSQIAAVPTSVLPPRLGTNEHIVGYSNVVAISQDCSHGAVVVASSTSAAVRLLGVAYDTRKIGITAFLLGRTTGGAASVHVTAFENGKDIGQVDLRF